MPSQNPAPAYSRREFLGTLSLLAASLPALAGKETPSHEPAQKPEHGSTTSQDFRENLLNLGNGSCVGLGGNVVIATAHQGLPSVGDGRFYRVHHIVGPSGEATDLVLFRMRGLDLPVLPIAEASELPFRNSTVLRAKKTKGGEISYQDMFLLPSHYRGAASDHRLPYVTPSHLVAVKLPQEFGFEAASHGKTVPLAGGDSGSALLLGDSTKKLIGIVCLRVGEGEIGAAADVTEPVIRAQIQDFISGKEEGSLLTPTMKRRGLTMLEWSAPAAILGVGGLAALSLLGASDKQRAEGGERKERLVLKSKY